MLVFDDDAAAAAADDDDGNYCHYNYVSTKATGMRSAPVCSTRVVVQFHLSVSYCTDIRCVQGQITASLGGDTLREMPFNMADMLSLFTLIYSVYSNLLSLV